MGAIIVATGFQGFDPTSHDAVRLRSLPQRLHGVGGRASAQRVRSHRRQDRAARRFDSQAGRHRPLRRQPRPSLPPLLLACLLHVLAEAGAPGQGKDRRRGLQLLHRHPHARQGLRRVLRTRAARGSQFRARQGRRRVAWSKAKMATRPR